MKTTTPTLGNAPRAYDEQYFNVLLGSLRSYFDRLRTSTTPGDDSGAVQFNNAGEFGGSGKFVWDDINSILTIGEAASIAYLLAASALTGSAGAGAPLYLFGGSGDGAGGGGSFLGVGGAAGDTGVGGDAQLTGGTGGGTSGDGGNAAIVGGLATSGNGGDAVVQGGGTSAGNGGDVLLEPGAGTGGINGSVVVGTGAALATNATGGFLMIPTCAGVPTGVPGSIPTGKVPLVFDTTGNALYIYNGAWKKALFV